MAVAKKKAVSKKKSKKGTKKEENNKTEKPKKTKLQRNIQPEVNIGLVGHVDHGKTTLTEKLSGKWTDTHSEEVKRGITIRLGYADTSFYKCKKCKYYTVEKKCPKCGGETEFLRKLSFVDAPGHESLMATMLCGATIMDGAILLVAANEKCPQPQTAEHLMALQIIGIKNIVVVQNKIDLVSKEEALENYKQIKEFLKNTEYKDAPIIPISALQNVNINYLIEAIEKYIPTPKRELDKDPLMFIARSFDINKPGTKPSDLVGGILGGAIVRGTLRKGDEIEIRPGRILMRNNKLTSIPLRTKIISEKSGNVEFEELKAGGSIALLTNLDPSVVKSDSLAGGVVGYKGKLPEILYELNMKVTLLDRVVGAETEIKTDNLKMNEVLMLNVNSAATVGVVQEIKKNNIVCKLRKPVCADKGSRVTISRRVGTRFRLIGYGIIE